MTERYCHLDPAYLHSEMDTLMRFEAPPPPGLLPLVVVLFFPFVPPPCRRPVPERDTGVEPATFSLGIRKGPFRAVTGSAK